MASGSTTCESRDILSSPWRSLVVFGVPVVAMVVAGSSAFSGSWRTIVWTVALGIMGAACTVNAVRCGRVHCYITGPFFSVMALTTLLYGLGILPLGQSGWNLIGLTILVGAIVLCCLPEMFFGKYREIQAEDDNRR